MKKQNNYILLLLLLSSLLFSVYSCQTKNNKTVDIKELRSYPNLEQVLTHFDENYSPPENTYIDLQKKPEGYFITTTDAQNKKDVFLFWSLKEKKFQQLPASFNARENANTIYSSLIQRAYNFDHSLYCNYPEAADEAIAVLGDAGNLNDTLLEALARAYNLKCDNLVGTRSANYGRNQNTELGKMDNKNVKTFIETGKLLIKTEERLIELNPNYQTLVGKIKHKMANDHLTLWYELITNGYPDKAKEFISQAKFDSLSLNYAKNCLFSCPPNAILFTSGDNDTYPLWFTQHYLNYRKDVAVINVSLANIPFYNNWHLKEYNLKTTFSNQEYQDSLLTLVFLRPDEVKPSLSTGEMFNHIKESLTHRNNLVGAGTSKYLSLPCKSVFIPATKNYTNSRSYYNQYDVRFDFNRNYLSLSDLFQIDLIYSNQNPVCYMYPGGVGLDITMMNYIENYGLVNTLVKGGVAEEYNFYYPYFNPRVLDSLLLQNYRYTAIYNEGFDVSSLVLSYFYQFITIAGQLVNKKDIPKAAEFIDRADQEFEMERLVTNHRILFYAGITAFDCQRTEIGKKYWAILLNKIENDFNMGLSNEMRSTYIEVLLSMTAQKEKIDDEDFMSRIDIVTKLVASPPKN